MRRSTTERSGRIIGARDDGGWSHDGLAWTEFAHAAPQIAAEGERLLQQFGIGLAFIATTRKDGGPRLHPCCPQLADGRLYVFVTGPSPKRFDLERDGRHALHTFPPADDDEFYCTGRARSIGDASVRAAIAQRAKHDVRDDEVLFELSIERALFTTWINPRQPDTRPATAGGSRLRRQLGRLRLRALLPTDAHRRPRDDRSLDRRVERPRAIRSDSGAYVGRRGASHRGAAVTRRRRTRAPARA
jgi:hypothetical protein